jgi:ubiquinone/menaquinone biosynthesis C-methylase UbiE
MSWNKWTEQRLSNITSKIKEQRVKLFIEKLGLGPDDQILDLGSEDGSYLSKFYPYPHNITIADIFEEPMKAGVKAHGLKGYRVIPVEGKLPMDDGEFDAIWCNSVIEHVTIPRDELGRVSNPEFIQRANQHQLEFAQEIARIGKKYLVQTPNINFPVESHSWLPLIPYLPQNMRYWVGQNTKSIWVKQWTADFYLYSESRFKNHYPDASEIVKEKAFGLTKSYIALRV